MYGVALDGTHPTTDTDSIHSDYSEEDNEPGHYGHHHPHGHFPKKPVVYAYDAAAEREAERLRLEEESLRTQARAQQQQQRRGSGGGSVGGGGRNNEGVNPRSPVSVTH